MLADREALNIRRASVGCSNLICPYCHSDRVTSIGQHKRINSVFYMWWRCNACHKRYGMTT